MFCEAADSFVEEVVECQTFNARPATGPHVGLMYALIRGAEHPSAQGARQGFQRCYSTAGERHRAGIAILGLR